MSFVKSLAKLRRREPQGRPSWLIVGLGNPGAQYAKTRHNIGFMVLNRIAGRAGSRFHSAARDRADVALVQLSDVDVMLAQPQTYMNESGTAVARLSNRLGLESDHIVLIYDDVDLPFGAVRIRESGSAGGHRGVQSVVDSLRTDQIPRIRLGIGRGSSGTKDYVLAEFNDTEKRTLPNTCDLAVSIVETILRDGVVSAMNAFNRRAPESDRAASDTSPVVGSQQ